MSEKYYLDEQGLAEVANHVNSRLKTVTVMPQNPVDGIVRLYVGATNNNFTKGHIYQYNTNAWTDITEVDQTFNPSSINAQSGIAIGTELDKKVDKESGKGLSTNDFTDALKDKLDGIETGAQVNTVTGVKGDSESSYRTGDINITKDNIGLGNVVNTGDSATPVENGTTKFTTGGAYTELNKKVDKENGKGLSTNDFTDALKTKLEGIETGAEVNVQSDWSQTNNASDDFIKNKPVIDTTVTEDSSNLITSGAVYTAIANETSAREDSESAIQDEIDDIDDRVSDIEDVIPNQASVSNQLADKDFVNSSIATNTANFLGTFESISDLRAYSGTVTNNDYAFVRNSVVEYNGGDFPNVTTLNNYDKNLLTNGDYAWVVNSEDNTKFDLYRFDIIEQSWILRATKVTKSSEMLNSAFNRYKATVSGSTVTWIYEYTLNNSSFTAEQWATINSGLTQESVASDISSAINDLYADSVGGSGKYISAISESDGIISATEGTIDSSPTQGSNNLITSGAVYTGLDGKVDKSTAVTGVKGNSESTYRTGNVNITKANVGLGSVVDTGDSATPVENGTTKFTTGGAYTELVKKVDKVSGKGLSTNDFTDALKDKLDGIQAGAEVNVQSDWTQTDNTKDDFIKNKPSLATVATSGSYNDLSDKPTIPTVDSALSSTSTNPVQNKVINTALGGKVDKEDGKGLSTNDFTDTLKNKLDEIEAGAQVNSVTGVKGNAETNYRTGNINLTPANLGASSSSDTCKWTSVYSGSTSSGYFLIAQKTGAYVGSNNNHDVMMAGTVYSDKAGTSLPIDFQIYARGRGNSVSTVVFRSMRPSATTYLKATYEVVSNSSSQYAIVIRLYGIIAGSYHRFNTKIDYSTAGDVSARSSPQNITYLTSIVTELTGTEIDLTAYTVTQATKLSAARKTYVTLGTASTTTTRDWSGDTTIPVDGTLAVTNGGTGMTTASYKNAVVIGNSSTVTNAMQTVRTANGAFYATAQDAKPQFGTLPVLQGGTGATSAADARTNLGLGNSATLDTGTTSGTVATGNHTHTLILATDSGTSAITLAHNTKYKLTAGGNSVVFTTPTDSNTDTKVTQSPTTTNADYRVILSHSANDTAETDTVNKSTKLKFNPDSGNLKTTKVTVGDNAATMQYNSTTQAIDFVFN